MRLNLDLIRYSYLCLFNRDCIATIRKSGWFIYYQETQWKRTPYRFSAEC